jgi:hypothetical protein
MNSFPCTVCAEAGHHASKCPTLAAPLKPGFYSPPAGHRPSGDDEDDEKLKVASKFEHFTFLPKRKQP